MATYSRSIIAFMMLSVASINGCATECPEYEINNSEVEGIYNFISNNIEKIENGDVGRSEACFSFCEAQPLLFERFYNEVENECQDVSKIKMMEKNIAREKEKCIEGKRNIDVPIMGECKILYRVSMPIRNRDNNDSWIIIRKDYRKESERKDKPSEIKALENWEEWVMFYVRFSRKQSDMKILEVRQYEIANVLVQPKKDNRLIEFV